MVAAIAAFASTGNAGIMSASRYPFAMAKDDLLPDKFATLGRFGTPTVAIAATVLTMVVILILFDVKSVAKVASAFQLLLFGLVSLCVIVMRESKIKGYKPGFKSPFYPWVQILGLLISFWLIVEMGMLSIGFTGVLIIGCAVWYHLYASSRTERAGAIFHVTACMAENQYKGLDKEMMTIINERTDEENWSYESVISRADMIPITSEETTFDHLAETAASRMAEKSEASAEQILQAFEGRLSSGHPLGKEVIIWYGTVAELQQPELVIFYLPEPAKLEGYDQSEFQILLFLAVPKEVVGLDLRLAGHVADIINGRPFRREWAVSDTDQERREILMRDDNFYHVYAEDLPGSCLITLIERGGNLTTAKPNQILREKDEVSIIGEPEDLRELRSWLPEPEKESEPSDQS